VTHVRHYRKLLTRKEEAPETSSEIVAGVVVVGYAMPKGTTQWGRVEGGSKPKIEEIALAANETVAPLFEILLT